MKHVIALSSLLFALNAYADCPSGPPAGTPRVPDGVAATEQAMLDSKRAVLSYVSEMDAFLNCRGHRLNDRNYNRLVDRAVAAAESFNRELHSFRQHQAMLASN